MFVIMASIVIVWLVLTLCCSDSWRWHFKW